MEKINEAKHFSGPSKDWLNCSAPAVGTIAAIIFADISGRLNREFGLRRAQGPDGGVSASRYSYMGGFDGTSDVLAGYLFGVPIRGTHAHSYVQSFTGIEDLKDRTLAGADGKVHDFVKGVLEIRKELGFRHTNEGELASFIAYAQAFPEGFLALVDTYDTLKSGVPNFICVALGLLKIRLQADRGEIGFRRPFLSFKRNKENAQ